MESLDQLWALYKQQFETTVIECQRASTKLPVHPLTRQQFEKRLQYELQQPADDQQWLHTILDRADSVHREAILVRLDSEHPPHNPNQPRFNRKPRGTTDITASSDG